jgi:trehalose 6-phosphate synthase
VQVDAFPAAVDVAPIESLSDAASQSGRVGQVRAELGDPRTVILAVERLDFTKGVEQRLEAYRGLLADGRLRAGETVLVQVLAPSRLGIPRYQQLRARVAELIARINAEFGPAVHYIDHFLPIEELVPLYRAADVMAVTPLRDGMNLVAKEFVASRTDFGGRLVLSRYAGAVDQLGRAALLVDPRDVRDVQGKLMQAIQMGPEEAASRMRELRASFVGHDANQWGRTVLDRIERSRRPTAMRVVREPDTAPPRRRGRRGPSTMDRRG